MVNIRWTREAEIWLKDIHDFIARDNKKAAQSVIGGIYGRTRILCKHPLIGQRYRLIPDGDIRILLYGHYRIAYLVKLDDNIDILGVFHSALDIERYLPF